MFIRGTDGVRIIKNRGRKSRDTLPLIKKGAAQKIIVLLLELFVEKFTEEAVTQIKRISCT